MKLRRTLWLCTLFAASLLWGLPGGCSGGRKPATVSGGGVTIKAPGAMSAQVKVRALDKDALARLPKVNADGGPVAAAEFEPSGYRFGTEAPVTWPLAEPMSPGAELWIVTYDNDLAEWLNTGRKAIVQPGGRSALGAVTHFSVIGLSKSAAAHTEEEDPLETQRQAYKRIVIPKFPQAAGGSDHAPETIDQAKFDAAKKVYQDWAGLNADRPMTVEAMCDIYRVADYKTVKALIQQKVIGETHSLAMADLRTAMVLETLISVGTEKKWAIYRSDTGNQASGMASDMDQTLQVYEIKPDGREVRVEKFDAELCGLFKRKFDGQRKGITTESFDICSIAGADNPPEWRLTQAQIDAHNLRPVKLQIAETMLNLRKTPGAYTYIGAIVSQVQKRQAQAIENKLRPQADIEAGKPARAESRPQALADEVKRLGVANTDQLAMQRIGPDAAGSYRCQEVARERAVEVMFNGVKPDLARGHAYDSAVASYIEHMHHLNDRIPEVKYHLRALNDAAFLLAFIEGAIPEKGVEYESLSAEKRTEYLRKALGADLPEAFLNRWKKCLDISAAMRQAHKQQNLNDALVEKLMAPLAAEFGESAPGDPDARAQARELALAAYRSRCQEFLTYNIARNCRERVLDWLIVDPNRPVRNDVEKLVNADDVRKAIDPEGRIDPQAWEKAKAEIFANHSDIARLQLMLSFRELPQELVDRCMRELERGRSPPIYDATGKLVDKGGRQFTPEELAKVKALVEDARNPKWAEKAFAEYPSIYKAFYEMEARQLALASAEARTRTWERWSGRFAHLVLSQVGLGAPEPPAKIVEFCQARGWKALTMPVNNRAMCITGRVVTHYICDPGSYQAGVEVMRAYAESDGDPKVWRQAAMQQALYMIPVFGQLKAAVDADWQMRAILVLSYLIPEVGWFQMTLAVGDSALVIYENEFVRPISNGLADAAYKGWVGPALQEFGVDARSVKPFTGDDEQELTGLQEKIAQLDVRAGPYEEVPNAKGMLSEMLRREQELGAKRAAWEAYNAEINRFEHNDQATHRRVDLPSAPDFTACAMNTPGAILARVKPVVFYSRANAGDIDFTRTFTREDADRLAQLPGLVKAEKDPVRLVALQEELDLLSARHLKVERAQRYLEAMKTNSELALQIQRDSLYPYRLTDEEAKADMKNLRIYAEDWLRIRRDILPQALQAAGVGDGTWNPHVFKEAGDALGDRLGEDWERSKRLWLARGQFLEQSAKAEEIRFRKRQHHEVMNVLGEMAVEPPVRLIPSTQEALTSAGVDPVEAVKLNALAQALRLRHMPEAPPVVKVGLVCSTGADNRTVITPDVKITANPDIYMPPYEVVWYQLGPDDVRAAYASKTYRGLPLSDDDAGVLKAYLDALGPDQPKKAGDQDPVNPLFLTFVFCQEAKIPNRVVPKTVSGLPALGKYPIPMPEGMVGPDGGKNAAAGFLAAGYLFGSYACMLQPTGPLQVELRRYDSVNLQSGTGIRVTSDGLVELDRKQPGASVNYSIYLSTTEGGPFTKVSDLTCRPGKPIVPDIDTKAKYERIAKNRWLLALDYPYLHSRRNQWPDVPLYYRVGEQSVPQYGKPGREILSSVVGPGKAVIFVGLNGREDIGEKAVYVRKDMGKPQLFVYMGLDNQYFNFHGAHVIINDGVRDVHLFSTRREGAMRFCETEGSDDSDAGVRLLMNPPPGDMPISITADCIGYSAKRNVTISVELTERQRKDLEHNLQFEKAKYDSGIANYRSGLALSQETIANGRKELSRKPAVIKDYEEGAGWRRLEMDLAHHEHQAQMIAEYDLPLCDVEYGLATARLNHDWATAGKLTRRRLELMRKDYDIDLARIRAIDAVRQKYQSLPGAPSDLKDVCAVEIENLKMHAYSGRATTRASSELVENAYLAGDAQLLSDVTAYLVFAEEEAGRLAAAKGWVRNSDLPRSQQEVDRVNGRLTMECAEKLVDLTGNRAAAAELYAKGYRNSGKTPPLDQLKVLPAWWPESKAGQTPAAPAAP